jgi:hypothetical protein
MNNTQYFNRVYMLPIENLAPKSIYVTDGQGKRLPFLIPIKGLATAPEHDLYQKIVREKGTDLIEPLMKRLAETVASQNGGNPVKVLEALERYRRGEENSDGSDVLGQYRAYLRWHCEQDFKLLKSEVEDGALTAMDTAAAAHAILTRVPPSEKFNPAKWKTEMALPGGDVPPSIVRELATLYYLESKGRNLAPYINDKNEFCCGLSKEEQIDIPAVVPSVEEVAGK